MGMGGVLGNGKDNLLTKKVSATCRQFEEGTCAYKVKHKWKERLTNPWIPNKGNTCDSSGSLVLCTLGDFNYVLNTMDDYAIMIINNGYIDKEFLATRKDIYSVRGFNITAVVADNSFAPMK